MTYYRDYSESDSHKPSWAERLRDPRWQKKARQIAEIANWTCEDCGCKTRTFEVHHTAYIPGKDPWEYDISLLILLCFKCHDKRQGLEDGFRVALGRITRWLKPEQLEEEVWRVLKDVSTRETSRLASAFSTTEDA